MLKLFALIALLFSMSLFAQCAFAGGGRIELNVLDNYGIAGSKPIRVQATVSLEDYSGKSVGEKVEFRLVNPRPGDVCTTASPVTDGSGNVSGECRAAEPGGLTFFLHSFDKNQNSNYSQLIEFQPAVKTATSPAARSSVFPSPVLPPADLTQPEPASPVPTATVSSSPTAIESTTNTPMTLGEVLAANTWPLLGMVALAVLIVLTLFAFRAKPIPQMPIEETTTTLPTLAQQPTIQEAPLLPMSDSSPPIQDVAPVVTQDSIVTSHVQSRKVIVVSSVLLILAAAIAYWFFSSHKPRTESSNPNAPKIMTETPLPSPEIDSTAPIQAQPIEGPGDAAVAESNPCFTTHFTDPSREVQIRTSLDSGTWTDWVAQGKVCYTKVKNGNHTFSVQARDPKGNESEVVVHTFVIYIEPTYTISLSGQVYQDNNCNYKFDAGDAPEPNVLVYIYRFEGTTISTLANKTWGDDGKYQYSTTIKDGESYVIEASPYRGGFSVIAMSGLPQKVTLSPQNRKATQDIPMIESNRTSICP